MIIAVHQPNFAPWLGFFDKMARVDMFVYLDDAEYSRSGYTNRTQIKGVRGAEWLSVPVLTSGRAHQLINEVRIDDRAPWGRKHVARLGDAYRTTPGWARVQQIIAPILHEKWDALLPLNIRMIEGLRNLLCINTPTMNASVLKVTSTGTQRLVDISRAIGADAYLTGAGALSYLEPDLFAQAGIAIVQQRFHAPTYPQPHGPFIGGLSAIDALCARGDATRDDLPWLANSSVTGNSP